MREGERDRASEREKGDSANCKTETKKQNKQNTFKLNCTKNHVKRQKGQRQVVEAGLPTASFDLMKVYFLNCENNAKKNTCGTGTGRGRAKDQNTTCTVGVLRCLLPFGHFFFSGSASLARVTALFLAVTVFLSCCFNTLDINTKRDG